MTSLERAAKMKQSEIAAMLDQQAALEHAHETLSERVGELQQQLDWFKRQFFGEKSERQLNVDPSRQLSLGESVAPPAEPEPAEETTVPSHTRRKRRSKGDVLSEGLRFDESVPMTVIELVDGDMDGIPPEELVLVDEKRTYRLAQRPAAYEIVCYARKTYKHRKTGQFFCAPAPAGVLERSCADVSLLAGLLVDKLLYHLPLYRQHQRLADAGITVSRGSLTNWTQRAIDLLEPIHEAQLESILAGRTLTMDETPIKAGRRAKGKMKRGYFWPVYGDFSVHATEPILSDDTGRQEHLARYITRAPLRIDAVDFAEKGQVKVRTPFDPRSGQRELFLDELELIRRLCAQIPDPRQHMVRYYGHYANRARGARGKADVATTTALHDTPTERARRRSWARLLKRVFEVDPLLCPQCGVEMRFVAVIQDFSVVDRILAHLRRIGGNDPHEGTAQRAPPAKVASVVGP